MEFNEHNIMSSLQQQSRFRTFIPTAQGVFRQSLSGSETDVSTSNENLSNEEKYVIRHTARQEPQGQENLQSSNRSSLRDSLPSNRSSLDVSSSSYNTLIIHSAGDEPWTGRNSGAELNQSSFLSHQSSNIFHDTKLSPVQKGSSASPSASISNKDHSLRASLDVGNVCIYDTGMQEITAIPDHYLSESSVLKHLAKEVNKVSSPNGTVKDKMEQNFESRMEYESRPPPPEYPKYKNANIIIRSKIKAEKVSLSKSQPDLSKVGVENMGGDLISFKKGVSVPRPKTRGREEIEAKTEAMWSTNELIDTLIKENSALKMELDTMYQRVSKSQKFEQDILKVHRAHEDLVQSCDRRERLERAARSRLQGDNRRLQELNRALREQVDLLSTQMLSRTTAQDSNGPESLRRELGKREVLIAQLITQNKELVAAKERQEIELAAQRATLQEQRTHIDILEAALTNAQGNVVRLEEECRKKQVYVERVAQLQRALSSLQLASDRREQTERKLRLQLELELQRTKNSNGGDEGKNGWDSLSGVGNLESFSELKRRLRDREEKIMRLEGECSKWEQRYLEESALRQAAIDAASIPKDAKIAALEKTSQETEKIIAEARSEKIRHMDEVHATQKKVADLESRLKDLESKLAERDAMIRVLQKHTYDKDVTSMLGRSPHHTPHASLGGPDIDHVLGTTVSREELVSSVLTGSTGFGSGNSYAGSDSSYHMPCYSKYETNKSFDSTKQCLDNQLKEIDSQLDSQLLSKRGLCCFPGFTNPVTAPRKGKIPKPLLASVSSSGGGGGGVGSGGGGGGSVVYESAGAFVLQPVPVRHDSGDMLLLEKQGRTSQQQRMQEATAPPTTATSASAAAVAAAVSSGRCRAAAAAAAAAAAVASVDALPPSSLPRPPPRPSLRSGLPRRLGDYNRLTENDERMSSASSSPHNKFDGGESLSSNVSGGSSSNGGACGGGRRTSSSPTPPSPPSSRSMIPSPRKLGEYGRLSESGGSSASIRKPTSMRNTHVGSSRERNCASTLSDNSASSLPPPSKVRHYGSGCSARRGSSLGREGKSSSDSNATTGKYRIQF